MSRKAGIHRATTLALSCLMALIGVGLVVEAATGDGGVLSVRTVLGVLFVLAGVGRSYVELRKGGPR